MRVYCICLDGAPPNLMSRFARDGTLPNLGKILSNGSWSRAVPSLPTVTSVNWTTMVTGLHCGSHGRPHSNRPVRYFWEAAVEKGIPVGVANVEHNELGGSSFFVGHPSTIAGPLTLPVESGGSIEHEILTQEGAKIASLECTTSGSLEAIIRGETEAGLSTPRDTMSEFAVFRSEDGIELCTRLKYIESNSSVYVSPIRKMRGFAEPHDIEDELLRIAGPPPVKGFPLFHHGKADLDTAIEEETHHARWFGRIAAGMMAKHEDSLWFHRHNTTDGIGHYYLGLVDERAYCYHREALDSNWDALRRWYRTLDLILGEIMEADPDAKFAMCTDHGHVGYGRLVSLAKLLVDQGLAKTHPRRPMTLDPEGSKVWVSAEEIFVNKNLVKGDGEYEEVRDRVIQALRGLVDPDNSRQPVALAIRREDAQCLSFWGGMRGDVIFLLDGGYFAIPFVTEDVFKQFEVPTNSSVHHGCFPGHETDVGSTFSFMAYSVHPGGERDISDGGAPHLVDFAPTVLAMLGVSDPGLQGRVLWDMIGLDQ